MTIHREEYIDGMKGLACLFVFWGHFTGIYKYAENATALDSWLIRLLTKNPLSFFTSESFWLQLFFVVSGYLLVMHCSSGNGNEFVKKCMKRVLRLALPILGTAIFVLIIQNTIGFYNFRIQDIIKNNWLTHFYGKPLTLGDVFIEPYLVLVFGVSKFNSPFWCLRDMLVSSLLIYFVGWICRTVKMKGCVLFFLVLLSIVTHREVICACLIGASAGILKTYVTNISVPKVVSICGVCSPVISYVLGNILVMDLAFAMCVLFVPLVSSFKTFLEKDIVKKLGNISFGIYALHWSLVNSVGIGILYILSEELSSTILIVLSMVMTMLATFVLAIVFKATVEKGTAIVCKAFTVKP